MNPAKVPKKFHQLIEGLPPKKRLLLALRNPMTFSQRRMWFLDRLHPGSSAYNIPMLKSFEYPTIHTLAKALEEGDLPTEEPLDGEPTHDWAVRRKRALQHQRKRTRSLT